MGGVSYIAAAIAGTFTFLSPCILPMIPTYLTYLGGGTGKLTTGTMRAKMVKNAVAFSTGFGLLFTIAGVALAGAFGFAGDAQVWVGRIGGIIIMLFGLFLLGVLKIGALERTYRAAIPLGEQRGTYASSFLLGASFAAGWSPCVGAILSSILILAATNPIEAIPFMLSYSAGLGLPFIASAYFGAPLLERLRGKQQLLAQMQAIAGLFLVVLGGLMFTDNLGRLNGYLVIAAEHITKPLGLPNPFLLGEL